MVYLCNSFELLFVLNILQIYLKKKNSHSVFQFAYLSGNHFDEERADRAWLLANRFLTWKYWSRKLARWLHCQKYTAVLVKMDSAVLLGRKMAIKVLPACQIMSSIILCLVWPLAFQIHNHNVTIITSVKILTINLVFGKKWF